MITHDAVTGPQGHILTICHLSQVCYGCKVAVNLDMGDFERVAKSTPCDAKRNLKTIDDIVLFITSLVPCDSKRIRDSMHGSRLGLGLASTQKDKSRLPQT